MKIKYYIEMEEEELSALKERLEIIDKKIIKFGLRMEEELLRFLIPKKEKLLNELKNFKK